MMDRVWFPRSGCGRSVYGGRPGDVCWRSSFPLRYRDPTTGRPAGEAGATSARVQDEVDEREHHSDCRHRDQKELLGLCDLLDQLDQLVASVALRACERDQLSGATDDRSCFGAPGHSDSPTAAEVE
jgi:hypothetical protein